MLRPARDEAAPLLGRAQEESLLTSLLDEVGERGQALVLRGDPGIGKSRLLSVAAQTARERGMTVLTATGVQSEAHLPFAGLQQLLRSVRRRAAELPPIQRDALDAAFGLTREAAPEHYRIAMAALDLVSDVAGDAPLLLVVEDAHWIDRPTADVLAFVARRIESDPVVLLAAARDGYPSALADAGLPEHRLAGLDDATAASLLDAAAPDLPLAARNRVLGEAAGNPLALLELPVVAGRTEDESSVPGMLPLIERLERAFAGRVSELPDVTRHVLLVAALSDGDAVDEILEAAGAVAGTSVDLDALEPAVGAALIDLDVNAIRFRHPLVRSAVRRAPVWCCAAVRTRRSPRRSTPIPTAACGCPPRRPAGAPRSCRPRTAHAAGIGRGVRSSRDASRAIWGAPMMRELHLADWRATKDTLHLYCQVIGKIRLATTAPRNHWWNVPLYVDVRGLTTRRLHHAGTTFEITLDFVDHAVVVRTSDGRSEAFGLHDGLDVAEFDRRLHVLLAGLGVDVEIRELPFGLPITTPFPADHEHAAWDREYVERFWAALDWTDGVLEEFSGWFKGKTSPVHLFWHGLDLAVTRFSGRDAPTFDADAVTQEAYSSEVISFGFWAGDDNLGDAAFYSYTAPEPDGLREQPVVGGEWRDSGNGSLAIIPYETVRTAADPRATLLAFLQSAYEAGARTAGWDASSLESSWCPTPEQLKALRAGASDALGRPLETRT